MRPPRIVTHSPHEERKISWLELFFDLVFVLVISELTHLLSLNICPTGLTNFVLLFFPSWWVWMGSVYYNERFDVDHLESRLFTFLLMLPCFGFAVFAHHFSKSSSTGFALSYVAARLIIIAMWLRGMKAEERFRPIGRRLISGYSFSVAVFLGSLMFTDRSPIWALALLSDLLTPLWTLRGQANMPKFNGERLAERLGLFILIVLGETLVSIVRGVARHHHFSFKISLEAVLAFAVSFSLWWIYFDYIAKRTPRGSAKWVFAWSYLHFPLVLAISGVGAGMLHVLTSQHHLPTASGRWLITGSLALCLVVLGAIESTLRSGARMSLALKGVAACLILNVGLWGDALHASGLLGLLAVCLAVPIGYGVMTRLHHDSSGKWVSSDE